MDNISDKVISDKVFMSAENAVGVVAANSLSVLTYNHGLSFHAAHLQLLLNAFEKPSNNMLEAINKNISILQDAFIEALYQMLSKNSIIINEEKVTLRLALNSKLYVFGEHPAKIAIEALLDETYELSVAFKEIAIQSELLKDINNLNQLVSSSAKLQSAYQISLKGEMSHFYFAKA